MVNKLEYPIEATYYICKDNAEVKSYGVLETNQVLETIFDIFTYLNEEDYLTELANNNIILEQWQ